MKPQTTDSSKSVVSPMRSQGKFSPLKTVAGCAYALAAVMLLSASARAAGPTDQAFQLASEAMIIHQTAVAGIIQGAFGVDPSHPLSFTSHVDPAGQNFSFALNAGSTYQGRPITFSASGTLDFSGTWRITSSGTYNSVPLNVTTSVVRADSRPHGSGSNLPPIFPGYIDLDGKTGWTVGELLGATQGTISCSVGLSTGDGLDVETCSVYDYFGEVKYTYTQGSVLSVESGGIHSGWSVGSSFYGAYNRGFIPFDGSAGNFTTTTTPAVRQCAGCSNVTLFSDLGSAGNVYQCCSGWQLSGTRGGGSSFTSANQFTVAASGSVSQIDIAVGHVSGANSFYAALYTVGGDGNPGTQLAQWNNLSSNTPFGLCCGIIPITNISGLSLTAGESYFLVLGPMNVNDTSFLRWDWNGENMTGLDLYSNDGGQTWNSNGQSVLGAFDVLGTAQNR